jgi:hypothetical protein
MYGANLRRRAHGRPMYTQNASAVCAPTMVPLAASAAVRSTGRSAHGRIRMWAPCARMMARSLGHRQRMRTPGKGSSHLVGAGSGVGSMLLWKTRESARGVEIAASGNDGFTKIIASVFKGRYLLQYSAFGLQRCGVGGE